jgi:hypothetical protein
MQLLVGKIEVKKTLGRSGEDGRIIMKWIFNKQDEVDWIDWVQDRIE